MERRIANSHERTAIGVAFGAAKRSTFQGIGKPIASFFLQVITFLTQSSDSTKEAYSYTKKTATRGHPTIQDHKRWGFRRRLWFNAAIIVLSNIIRKVFRFEIVGKENLPPKGQNGVILPANHLSLLDPFYIGCSVWDSKRKRKDKYAPFYMTSKKLMDLVFFRWVKYAGAFPVDKDSGKGRSGRAIAYSIEHVKDGGTVVIFPEGERSRTRRLQEPYPGVGWIAHATHASGGVVIPTAVIGSEKVMGRGILLPRVKGKVIVIFGKPLDLAKFMALPPTRDTAQQMANEIMNTIRQELRNYWLKRGYRQKTANESQ
ncbi:MAG: lysophospholipid acyltransferase family protein [Candidatus Hodarchaeota archaeon]